MSEKHLPAGWGRTQLGELVDVLDHYRVPVSASERSSRAGKVPYYGATGRVGWIDAPIFDEDLVLLGEDGVKFFDRSKPKSYVISGPSWVNNHAHVLRPVKQAVDLKYINHYLNFFNYEGYANGTTRLKLTKSAMVTIPVPLPPLGEQLRIVEVLALHLSRLDAALRSVEASRRRCEALRRSLLLETVPAQTPSTWREVSVQEAGKVDLGRQRHPDWHTGPEMKPYLRVANVFEDRIDTSDVMEMDFSGIFDRYRLHPGDILLNEGQSPHLVGRPAMYRGDPPEVAFTNSLLRFRGNPDVLPEWALLVFRRHMHARRFMREVRITTNIAHLSAARLKAVEFPVPPIEEQKRLVALAEERFRGINALDEELAKAQRRAENLRKAVLARAFTGGLVPQDPNDEPASELLARVQAERAAQPKPKRIRRTPSQRKVETTLEPEPKRAPTATTALPKTAIQQEFEL
ncbi:restriction endonuclease subunit S [Streptomyces lycii]|uniref:Restriction endonuclease subunit S n=1 Tax=Streptomyces lycii TaxID=2654337 RepID=A0ABQ7FT04_9ACTN|nr:restriction endonuclease subunit S [Streptomyces lycii]KAF4410963.1 restriction endonuclease subunit S [Streptomyces lycii]